MDAATRVYHALDRCAALHAREIVEHPSDADFNATLTRQGFYIFTTKIINTTAAPGFTSENSYAYVIIAPENPMLADNVNAIMSKLENSDAVIITANNLATHTQNKLNSFKSEQRYIVEAVYTIFVHDLFAHALVDPHFICSAEDTADIEKNMELSKLPKIAHTDPPVVLLNGRPGQLCEIHMFNENSIFEIRYRLIV